MSRWSRTPVRRLLSDPGERLVGAVIEMGGDVVPIPGPSAILAGLAVSGLPCVPFTFVGFPPRKAGPRARALERIIDATETTVLFESPTRLVGLLEELAARMGESGTEGPAHGWPRSPGQCAALRSAAR